MPLKFQPQWSKMDSPCILKRMSVRKEAEGSFLKLNKYTGQQNRADSIERLEIGPISSHSSDSVSD